MQDFTFDEANLLLLYYAETLPEQIANLEEMRGYLSEYETDLMEMTDSTLEKLRGMNEAQFAALHRSKSFDLEALSHI